MKIAIADGQSHIRSALCLLISEKTEHHVVLEIKRANTLLEQLRKSPIDMLIADWSFLAPDAQAIVKSIRESTDVKNIVVMSSNPNMQELAMQAGADSFLSKTNPPDAILDYLQHLSCSSQHDD